MRYGLHSELTAPKQISTAARRRPWLKAMTSASSVTGPPRLTPAIHDGRATEGRVNRVVPGSRSPTRIWITIRNTTTNTARRAKEPNDRAHGADVRRAATT